MACCPAPCGHLGGKEASAATHALLLLCVSNSRKADGFLDVGKPVPVTPSSAGLSPSPLLPAGWGPCAMPVADVKRRGVTGPHQARSKLAESPAQTLRNHKALQLFCSEASQEDSFVTETRLLGGRSRK